MAQAPSIMKVVTPPRTFKKKKTFRPAAFSNGKKKYRACPARGRSWQKNTLYYYSSRFLLYLYHYFVVLLNENKKKRKKKKQNNSKVFVYNDYDLCALSSLEHRPPSYSDVSFSLTQTTTHQ